MDRRPWGLLYAASTAPALSQILLEPTFAEGLAPPPQSPGTSREDAELLLCTRLLGGLGTQGHLALMVFLTGFFPETSLYLHQAVPGKQKPGDLLLTSELSPSRTPHPL